MSAERHLLSVADGDPALARSLRENLRTLAAKGPSIWRELAREVLAGRTDLREAIRSSAYSDSIRDTAQRFTEFRRTLSKVDEQRLAGLAEARLDRVRRDIERTGGS